MLADYISFNSDFRDSVNLYLDLDKSEKIKGFIPTKSSIDILGKYLESVVSNKLQSTLLIGPYGKGKSHLLLVLMAVLSMDRKSEKNKALVDELVEKVKPVDANAPKLIEKAWKKGRFLPVLISGSQGDLNQAFMVGLNEALKRHGLTDIAPESYYSYAKQIIVRWEKDFPETYSTLETLLKQEKNSIKALKKSLDACNAEALNCFKRVYPLLTSGSVFNPLVDSDVLTMYSKIADQLVADCGYSGIYIIFDEFSKYIESQDNTSAGSNMKVLQDVCELANASNHTQVFITMVAHKSIKEYGHHLSAATINSFTGIEGRIREVFFTTSAKNNYELIQNAIIKHDIMDNKKIAADLNQENTSKYYGLSPFKSEFTFEDFDRIVMKGCYPLTPISAYLLLNVSEKVAQNERTLFTFISKDEQHSVANFARNVGENARWAIGADLIYDYFKGLFKKDVTNRYVHNVWLQAEYALAHATNEAQKKVLKALAIISVVNKPEELPSEEGTLSLAAGVEDPLTVVEQLTNLNLIYKKASTNSYVFKTRATSELKTEINKRKALKAGRVNYSKVLSQVSELQFVLPKRYNHDFVMTRFFRYEYMDVQTFLEMNNPGAVIDAGEFCDGKFVALYSFDDVDYSEAIAAKIANTGTSRVAAVYKVGKLTKGDTIAEFEVIQDLKADTLFLSKEENKVLETELNVVEEDAAGDISQWIDDQFGEQSGRTVFYFENGEVRETQKSLSVVADCLSYATFPAAVHVNNELINKRVVSSAPIKKARREIIDKLLLKEDTGMYLNGTSAESTIYRALFVGTGLENNQEGENEHNMISLIDNFMSKAINSRQCLKTLIDELTAPPIGMRLGIIPIYLSYVIRKRPEDIVAYFGKKEVELDGGIILNMCETPEDYELFISSDDAEKNSYLQALIELFSVRIADNTTDNRINQIVTKMQRWYRSLPQVTKNIKKTNPYWTNAKLGEGYAKFKEMMQSVDVNSYETLFVNIPKAFKADGLVEAGELLAEMKDVLEKYYGTFLNRVVQRTLDVFVGNKQQDLYHTLYEWYSIQSEVAKNGLHSSKITGLMSLIRDNSTFDDQELVKKVAKTVTEIYIDSWNDTSLEEYIDSLIELKEEIEGMDQGASDEGKLELRFVGKNGTQITKYYDSVDEGTGAILRNILSDTLEDFSDLSVNDKVAILLEMIEKELG